MRLVWWLAAVTVISLVGIVFSERRALDPVQNLSLTATTPLASRLRNAARPVDDFFKGITDRGDIVRENKDLRDQIEKLQNAVASQQNAEQRVRELEDALKVKQARPEDQLLVANVMSEDTSGLKRMIAIDRGSKDGLDEGMVVLSRSGSLVGTVSRAFNDFSWVQLVTDPDSSVNAQVIPGAAQPQAGAPTPTPDVTTTPAAPTPAPPTSSPAPTGAPPPPSPTPMPTPVRGVAEGDLKHELILDLLPPDTSLAEGSLVTTSGLGGNYPRELLIGSVQGVEQRPQSPFTKATLKPAANLSTLDTVLVLLSFKPARLSPQ
ncbi:MAG: rod shape-determining protein MreC [Chloroflexi bacterium]|jgi:rod shape-determining protein MreC|nr:MAG: rod shape-determining protein MreC [Chloroflexota bacterium]TMG06539.1 MAG: rod shape-determining protein MreC [Chloroflexota bacterium]